MSSRSNIHGCTLRPVLIGAILALLHSARLIAQQDILLSPSGPPITPLRPDGVIQSAASIETTTLVAWGRGTVTVEGYSENALAMRLLRGKAIIDSSDMLHPVEARPYNVVSVMALKDRFLVFWNDRRENAPGIYLLRIDTLGNVIGTEERFSTGEMAQGTEMALLQDGDGFRTLWRDVRGTKGLHWRELDADGYPRGSESVALQRDSLQVIPLAAHPTLALIRGNGSLSLLHADGTIVETSIPSVALDRPYHLGDDLSFAYLDDTLFTVYRTITDPAPQWTQLIVFGPQIALLDLAWLGFIRPDSNEAFRLLYPRLTQGGTTNDKYYLWTELRDMRVSADSVGPVMIADTIVRQYETQNYASHECQYKGSVQTHFCNNEVLNKITVTFWTTRGSRFSHAQPDSVIYSISSLGAIDISHRALTAERCGAGVARVIRRPFVEGPYSAVEVGLDEGWVTLRTLNDTLAEDFVEQRWGIGISRGNLVFSWMVMPKPLFVLGRFDPGAATPIAEFRTITPDPLPESREEFPDGVRHHWKAHSLQHPGGPSILSFSSADGFIPYGGGGGGILRFSLFVASDTGWATAYKRSFMDLDRLHGNSMIHDPNTGITLLASGEGYNWQKLLLAVSDEGDTVWDDTTFPPRTRTLAWLVPTAMHDYMHVNDSSMVLYANGEAVRTIELPPGQQPLSTTRCFRLAGRDILRVYPKNGLDAEKRIIDSLLELEIYDINGALLLRRTIRLRGNGHPISIAQRSDSAIVLLYGSDNGIHAIMFDRLLNVLIDDSVISSPDSRATEPTGIFRNDTLYFVWRDYRNRRQDIYANRWVPGLLSTPPTPGPASADAPRIVGLYPNPTTTVINVEFELDGETASSFELFDMLGRLIRREVDVSHAAGLRKRAVDTRGLPPGVYTLVMRASGGTDARKIVVH